MITIIIVKTKPVEGICSVEIVCSLEIYKKKLNKLFDQASSSAV